MQPFARIAVKLCFCVFVWLRAPRPDDHILLARRSGRVSQFLGSLVENVRCESVDRYSLFVKVSWKTLFFKVWILTFCDRLVENVHFEMCKILIFAKASWKTFALTAWILLFCESLVQNVHFETTCTVIQTKKTSPKQLKKINTAKMQQQPQVHSSAEPHHQGRQQTEDHKERKG